MDTKQAELHRKCPECGVRAEPSPGTTPYDPCKLHAAAPALLEALELALRLIEGENLDECFDGEAETIRAAIEAAK